MAEHEHVRVAVIGSGFGGLGAAVRCAARGSPTSSSWNGPAASEAPGGTTVTPGAPVTCPPPVLLLLRTQPRVAPHLLRAAAHPRLPGARHRRVRTAPAPPLRLRGEAAELGPRGAALAHRDHARVADRRRRGLRHRPAVRPETPDVPGLDSFPGKVFHSARWDHDYDLRGKRVAMVGTGAPPSRSCPPSSPRWAGSPSSSAPRRG